MQALLSWMVVPVALHTVKSIAHGTNCLRNASSQGCHVALQFTPMLGKTSVPDLTGQPAHFNFPRACSGGYLREELQGYDERGRAASKEC